MVESESERKSKNVANILGNNKRKNPPVTMKPPKLSADGDNFAHGDDLSLLQNNSTAAVAVIDGYNMDFLQDMLDVVRSKPILPKLFSISLTNILTKTIVVVVFLAGFASVKAFVPL